MWYGMSTVRMTNGLNVVGHAHDTLIHMYSPQLFGAQKSFFHQATTCLLSSEDYFEIPDSGKGEPVT